MESEKREIRPENVEKCGKVWKKVAQLGKHVRRQRSERKVTLKKNAEIVEECKNMLAKYR